MPVDGAMSDKNQRSLSYLLDVYKLYQGHINTMFNFFLLTSGLLANAYIQVLQKQAVLGLLVACFGVLMSVLSCLIHMRSRELLDVIEAGLEVQERTLFTPESPGFLTARQKHKSPFRRYKYQLPFMHLLVICGFLAMSFYAAW
jgi:hypothetical protein